MYTYSYVGALGRSFASARAWRWVSTTVMPAWFVVPRRRIGRRLILLDYATLPPIGCQAKAAASKVPASQWDLEEGELTVVAELVAVLG